MAPDTAPVTPVWVWRHPQPQGVAGRCIGRTDVAVDRRRAKRLARRIQVTARRQGLGRVVHTSPLKRCADVGRWLKRWGWTHVIDAELLEIDFGYWDGQTWAHIGQTDVDAWCAAFATHAPGGGEPLVKLLQRAANWQPLACTWQRAPHGNKPTVVVGHAGWMLARRWVQTHEVAVLPGAVDWPKPPAYSCCWHV